MVVGLHTMTIKSNSDSVLLLRSVEHQSVPLSLNVIVLRLLSDVDTIKLQFSGQLLLSLEDDKRDLQGTESTGEPFKHTAKVSTRVL